MNSELTPMLDQTREEIKELFILIKIVKIPKPRLRKSFKQLYIINNYYICEYYN